MNEQYRNRREEREDEKGKGWEVSPQSSKLGAYGAAVRQVSLRDQAVANDGTGPEAIVILVCRYAIILNVLYFVTS